MAKDLAQRVGYIYVDTGAMYRCVTLFALRHGLFLADGSIDTAGLQARMADIHITFALNAETGRPDTHLNGECVERDIRSIEVSSHVSPIAALPFVREDMVRQQRDMGREGGIVMDGRDIGTVVFPQAELKIFVTATAEVRAQRRYDELKAKGMEADYADILRNVQERDYIDSHREVSPLRQAADALLLDNSSMSIGEQNEWLMAHFAEARHLKETAHELEVKTEICRRRLVEVVWRAKAGHIGGDLSCLNTLMALYFHVMQGLDPKCPQAPGRDRLVLSKGHCVEALYVTLEARGFLPAAVLDTLGTFGSPLSGHPTREVPGIEVNSGALGHGLAIGVGMAMAAKMDREAWRTYVLMGDGEQGEGSIYEAAMAASNYHLDNLVAIIDRNHLQISGDTEQVMHIDPICDRWRAFGWDVTGMNGDDMGDILRTFSRIDYSLGKPHLLIANTTKGRGVSFMEGVAKWHHGVLNENQYRQAVAEIEARIASLQS